MSTWAIVLACGKEQEISAGVDVAFLALGSRPILSRSLQTLEQNSQIDGVVLVVRKERVDTALHVVRSFGCRKISAIVAGGSVRLTNLKSAYEQIPDKATSILVHDSARPFVTDEVVTETVKAGKRYGAAVAAARSVDAVKLAEKGQKVTKTLDRNTVWQVQTPQVFKREVFEKVLKSTIKLKDDESSLLEKARQEIHLVAAPSGNMKIRTSEDLAIASAILSVARKNML
ncbi:MAG: 2-C-methyl-D-erythritol 4-phosphate cytidylyltransferase [Kiritimatiellales bacterium]|jgi:2-C-methyl-D-erythritol 4-phosphate cytidylyltransferase